MRERGKNGLRNGEKSFILHISIGGPFGKILRPVPPYKRTPKSPSSTKAVHLRAQAALIPGIRLSNKAQENIKDIVVRFYANPTGQVNCTILVAGRILYDNTRAQTIVSRDESYRLFSNVALAYDSMLKVLNESLARKVYDDSNITRSAAIPDLPRDQQEIPTQTVPVISKWG